MSNVPAYISYAVYITEKTEILQRITKQLCPDHTATNCNTLHNLFRILKETGVFPRVNAQCGQPRLVEYNVLGTRQRSPRTKSIHGIKC